MGRKFDAPVGKIGRSAAARRRALEVQADPDWQPPSPQEVLDARSWSGEGEEGAWTAAQLAEWGILWPPRAGWRGELERAWSVRRCG